ncbi:MAG: ABC transporter ATP-binding protein [Oscillospiraceae bacterium]|nr:ABC transporter ATP-binding protein [Oscillospiraceae bacterium]
MKNTSLRWLWAVPGKKKWYIVALTVIQAVYGASGVLYALLLRGVVDSAVGGDFPGFWRYLIWIILLAAAQLTLRALIRWLTELSKSTLENIFKARLAETLLRKDFLRVSAVHSGEWLNRLTNDTTVVAGGYVDIIPGFAGMVVKLVSALVMIIVLEPRFAAILIPCGVLLVFFTWLFRKTLKRLHKNVQEADGRLRVFLQERIGSLLMIRSFAAEGQTRAEAEGKMRAHKAARMRKNRFSNLANVGFGAVMSGLYLLGVGWCGYGILIGTVSFGTLTAITQLITQIQVPFANISGYLPRYYAMLASAERLMEAEAFEEDDTAAVKTPEEASAFYEQDLLAFGLKDAAFTYFPAAEDMGALSKADMSVVLRHLTLEIRKGEYVAFTGQSGCGKSTTLKLLMCVYQPDGGDRYYVSRNGERGTLSADFRRLFAYVPQGNYLMSGTIREVVRFAEPTADGDGERLARALKIACAEEFVSELENGVDTLLGERGTGLSEGQMQRLAIARAVFSGSPILLLDEATSALDAETERLLLQNLRGMTDKTVIIVTHRPAALSICDRVLEFTDSGVIDRDP